ncbi:hypothetical protein [Nesterenkonia flava]|uniref:Uncharacterized protein n=1 Tax=Nesterenkonia flava TaxID=469799 RepID=A0ABU1FRN9_9MICC|nr:hypothetical protein [Nesterenkonia flava]MDR5711314.1 hypothetical protein [Nesterenkonia flava]
MSADYDEQFPDAGDDLRSRYLPVSRKELRRRREAELAAQREAQEEAQAAEDTLASGAELDQEAEFVDADVDTVADASVEQNPAVEADEAAAVAGFPGSQSADESVDAAEQDEPAHSPVADDSPAEEELHRTVDAVEAAESGGSSEAQPEEDAASEDELDPSTDDELEGEHPTTESPLPEPTADEDPARPEEEIADAVDSGADEEPTTEPESTDSSEAEAPEAPLPEPAVDEDPARPEEDVADAVTELIDLPLEDLGELSDDTDESAPAEASAQDSSSEETPSGDRAKDDSTASAKSAETPEAGVEEEAPVPASRRARRLLRDTESIPRMSPELLAELDQVTGAIARIDDPGTVDPELLKKQQALAAKAMQANQERQRQEREAAEREERKRRRRERPESEVITRKTLRDSLEDEGEYTEYATGSIEPVHARGAHGLDLDKLVDETSRQADRQNMLLWLVIILSVLLVIAIGLVIYFVL